MQKYESEYHQEVHGYLHDDYYYGLRARISKRQYFQGMKTRGKKVFEYGIGLGQNIVLLDNRCGYDISKYAREFSTKKGIKVYSDEAKVPKGEFDIVLSSHVLEHLRKPYENLVYLRERLAKDGKLVLVLPKERHGRAGFTPDVHNHLFAWNFRAINNLLYDAGFEAVSNNFIYGRGYHALLPISKMSFEAYYKATWALGKSIDAGAMRIVARKR